MTVTNMWGAVRADEAEKSSYIRYEDEIEPAQTASSSVDDRTVVAQGDERLVRSEFAETARKVSLEKLKQNMIRDARHENKIGNLTGDVKRQQEEDYQDELNKKKIHEADRVRLEMEIFKEENEQWQGVEAEVDLQALPLPGKKSLEDIKKKVCPERRVGAAFSVVPKPKQPLSESPKKKEKKGNKDKKDWRDKAGSSGRKRSRSKSPWEVAAGGSSRRKRSRSKSADGNARAAKKSSSSAVAMPGLQATFAFTVVVDGENGPHKRFDLTSGQEIRIGRSTKSDIKLARGGVSSDHCILKVQQSKHSEGLELSICDNSMNGTGVEGKNGEMDRLAKGIGVLLSDGARVCLPMNMKGKETVRTSFSIRFEESATDILFWPKSVRAQSEGTVINAGDKVYINAMSLNNHYVEVSDAVGGGYIISTSATKDANAEFQIYKVSRVSGPISSGDMVYIQTADRPQFLAVSGHADGGHGISTVTRKDADAVFKIYKWSGESGPIISGDNVYIQALAHGHHYVEVSGHADGGYGICTSATKEAQAEFKIEKKNKMTATMRGSVGADVRHSPASISAASPAPKSTATLLAGYGSDSDSD